MPYPSNLMITIWAFQNLSPLISLTAGGPLSWNLEPEEVSLGLFLWPSCWSQEWPFHPSLKCSASYKDFYLFQYLWYQILSQSFLPRSNLLLLRYLGGVFFFLFNFFNKIRKCHGKDLLSIASTLLSTLPSCFPLSLLNLSYVAKNAVHIDANGCSLATY